MTRHRALIVEDEALASATLRSLLAEVDWLEVVGEVGSGPDALAAIETLAPDLVFLDIELPGCDGLSVVRQMQRQPVVIFTTAYDQHAVAAFELAALDYLLKPFGADRLAQALARARRVLDEGEVPSTTQRADEALGAARDEPLSRFFVRDRGKLVLVWARDVERLEADDDYVRVHTKGRVHLVYLTLNDFERRLDPERFVRIHRAHIVNLDFVSHLVPHDGGRIEVQMKDGGRLYASRTRSRELRRLAL
jgi:two-component system, LytTR family, response regulator